MGMPINRETLSTRVVAGALIAGIGSGVLTAACGGQPPEQVIYPQLVQVSSIEGNGTIHLSGCFRGPGGVGIITTRTGDASKEWKFNFEPFQEGHDSVRSLKEVAHMKVEHPDPREYHDEHEDADRTYRGESYMEDRPNKAFVCEQSLPAGFKESFKKAYEGNYLWMTYNPIQRPDKASGPLNASTVIDIDKGEITTVPGLQDPVAVRTISLEPKDLATIGMPKTTR